MKRAANFLKLRQQKAKYEFGRTLGSYRYSGLQKLLEALEQPDMSSFSEQFNIEAEENDAKEDKPANWGGMTSGQRRQWFRNAKKRRDRKLQERGGN